MASRDGNGELAALARRAVRWTYAQPYLLLTVTMAMWAGNTVLARAVTGDVPPFGLTLWRWIVAFAIILPFAWTHLRRDWPEMVHHWKIMVLLAATGVVGFNALNYCGVQYTTALNAVLLHSSTPLMIAIAAFAMFGDRLRPRQGLGIAISFCGVIIIIARGDPAVLASVSFNQGDLWIMAGMVCNAIFASCLRLRPQVHWLSYLATTSLLGVVLSLPMALGEAATGTFVTFDAEGVGTILYVAIGASLIAHLCFNRGVELIGSNRAGAFFHIHPVLGATMAIGLIGEELHAYHLVGFALTMTGVTLAARAPDQSGRPRAST